jgi:alpha-galactosidase
VTVNWSDLGIRGKHRIRDLWRQKDLGVFDEKFTARVNPHGVVMVRLFPL